MKLRGEERDRFEQQLLALADRGEAIASSGRAIAAIPISALEELLNRRSIGQRLSSKNVNHKRAHEKRMYSLLTIGYYHSGSNTKSRS
jgi:hypothetical protein